MKENIKRIIIALFSLTILLVYTLVLKKYYVLIPLAFMYLGFTFNFIAIMPVLMRDDDIVDGNPETEIHKVVLEKPKAYFFIDRFRIDTKTKYFKKVCFSIGDVLVVSSFIIAVIILIFIK